MKAAGYARYSTDKQTENSIAYQLNSITDYCKSHNIALCAVYSDEAESGTNLDRPGFQSLVEAAKRQEFDAVVIYDISRASRDVADWFSFRKEMGRLNISVISVTQNLGSFTDPDSFLSELINAGLSQHMVLQTKLLSTPFSIFLSVPFYAALPSVLFIPLPECCNSLSTFITPFCPLFAHYIKKYIRKLRFFCKFAPLFDPVG